MASGSAAVVMSASAPRAHYISRSYTSPTRIACMEKHFIWVGQILAVHHRECLPVGRV